MNYILQVEGTIMDVKLFFLLLFINGGCASMLLPIAENALEQSLAECALYIIPKHFDKNLPILVYLPRAWYPVGHPNHKIMQHLIEMLHIQNNVFQLVLGQVPSFRMRGTIIGSYVLVIPPLEFQSDLLYFRNVFEMIGKYKNFRGKLLVIAFYISSNLKSNNSTFSHILLDFAFIKEYVDTIVLQPETVVDVSLNKPNIKVFGWRINEQSNICSGYLDKTKELDTWISKEKKFLDSADLFTVQQKVNFRGCTLHAIITHFPPFAIVDGKPLPSLLWEILVHIGERVNAKIRWKNMSHRKKSDIHIYFPSVLMPDNIYILMFTYPHFPQDFTWLVPSGAELPRWYCLYRTFPPVVWFLVLLTFALGGCTMWLFDRSHGSTDFFKVGVMSALLTHLGVGIADLHKGFVAALFYTLWLFYCLVINTAYQSAFYGCVVNPGNSPAIQTVGELENSDLVLVRNLNFMNFYIDNANTEYLMKYKICQNRKACYNNLINNKTYAILESMWEIERMKLLHHDKYGRFPFQPLTQFITTFYFSFELDVLSSILSDHVERIVNVAVCAGLPERWKNMLIYLTKRNTGTRKSDDPFLAFDIDHLQGGYLILVTGLLLAIFLFALEICRHFTLGTLYLLVL
ncbi:Ionotropic receptor 907 [Blattella germanica]|nr:Ionotropic receptor 907 [Blattella germanica]